jgi:hypothetical protein
VKRLLTTAKLCLYVFKNKFISKYIATQKTHESTDFDHKHKSYQKSNRTDYLVLPKLSRPNRIARFYQKDRLLLKSKTDFSALV